MSRTWVLSGAMFVVVLTGCEAGVPSPARTSSASTSPAGSSERKPEDPSTCSDEIPFEPTYLPAGFETRLIRGPAPGSRPVDSKTQVIFHLRGDDSRAIEVRRPGTPFAELALGDDSPTIDVLGRETANFGPIEPGGDEFIVQITHRNDAEMKDRCSTFSLNEVGVPLGELKKVAERLREVE